MAVGKRSRRSGLNRRPTAYKAVALPLSYTGERQGDRTPAALHDPYEIPGCRRWHGHAPTWHRSTRTSTVRANPHAGCPRRLRRQRFSVRMTRCVRTFTRIVRHVPAGERKYLHHGYGHVRQGHPDLPGHPTPRGRPARPRDRRRRVPRPGRPLRLRQVHQPAHARRPRGGRRRAPSTSTRPDVTNLPPKARDIAMVFQNYALYPHMTVYENMAFALKLRKTPEVGDRPPGQGGRAPARHGRVPAQPQAEGALRWSAPAGRHGPRDRARAAGLPHGRAAVEPRRQAPRPDPCADRRAAAAPRHHHGLRDPRPGRGHDHGPPGGGPARRRAAAGRHPPGALRQARQRLRRRLHRLPGHEHQDRPPDRQRRRLRRPARPADP